MLYFKLGKMRLKGKHYAECAVNGRMCLKSFKFCAGDFLQDDAPLSSRFAEVDSCQIRHTTSK